MSDVGMGTRLRTTACALEQVVWFPVLVLGSVLTVVGAVLSLAVVGIPLLAIGIAINRAAGRRALRLVDVVLRTRTPDQHALEPDSSWLRRLRSRVEDPLTWRELVWTLAAATLGFAISLVVVLLLVLVVTGVLWWYAGPVLMRMRAQLDRWFLCLDRTERLEIRVAQLQETRAEVVDHSARELRRIERDLHDGAQARLVAVSMTLGMAARVYDDDPTAARTMLDSARESTQAALGDLRSVVRTIHPPVLADRGLSGAVEALAVDMALPVDTRLRLDGRAPEPVETAVYFAVCEALANVGKHSGATRAWIELRHDGRALRALIGDDGAGGADPGGTGLRGVATRLAAFDGTMWVSSPTGGPTVITLEVPCALSSPKTTPSSARD